MRKLIPCLSFTILQFVLAETSGAQVVRQTKATSFKNSTHRNNSRHVIDDILRKRGNDAPAKSGERVTSTLSERLVAASEYDYNPGDTIIYHSPKTDSGSYIYIGNQRGSSFDLGGMGYYSSGLVSTNYLSGNFYYGYGLTNVGHYFGDDVPCDTCYIWQPYEFLDSTGHIPYVLYDISFNNFDPSSNLTVAEHFYYPGLGGEINKYIYTYNSSGDPTSGLVLSYNAPLWDSDTYTTFLYSSSGQMIEDSTSAYTGPGWTPQEKQYYNYDGAGDMVYSNYLWDSAGIWQEQNRYVMTYNSDHTLHTDSTSQGFGSGVWYPQEKDSLGYTAGVGYYTYISMATPYSSGTDFSNVILQKHIGLSGLPDSVFYSEYSYTATAPSYLYTASKTAFVYDSYNNPVSGTSYNYIITDPSSGAGYYDAARAGAIYYYYETYSPSGVKGISAATEKITIYPNPATNEITVARPDAAKGTYTTITVTNMLGQMVTSESLPWINTSETISLRGVAAGTYLVTVRDKGGNVLTTQKVVKQ